MSTRRWHLALLAICVAAVGATAITLTASRASDDAVVSNAAIRAVGDPSERARLGREAVALVAFDPDRVGYAVRFEPGRPGVRARVDRSSATISVYLRDGDAPHVVAHDIAHELGHAYDQARMSDADRRDYLARRGVPGAAWLPAGDSDYAVGAGDFAEVFALCHSASPDFRGTLAPRPENACELLPQEAL